MARLRLTTRLVVACIALLGISACGGSSSANPNTTASSAGIDNEAPASANGDVLGVTLSGKSFSLRDTLASSPVVMWFWAPG
jgi:hypothetical protein